MEIQDRFKQFAAFHTAKTILKILPRVSEHQLLQFPLVKRGLDSVYRYYPEAKDFLQSLLVHTRRSIGRCSPNCLSKFAENLIVNEFIAAGPRREAFQTRYGFPPPFLMVLSPSMRCNLSCTGCYAGQYERTEELETEIIHRILAEGREMGVHFVTISGGEPFLRPDILDIFAVHGDIYFQVYTNGTLIDESLARRLARLGNVLPAISVEGWQEQTDRRRGPGTFAKVLSAMAALKKEGVLFGFSATATRENNELIMSDEFVQFLADQGCFNGWYFQYIPIGERPRLDLMPTPEQRIYRRKRLVELRKSAPVVLLDFWNDGPLVGGCIAADRYLHINNRGEVEPCVFLHFAVDNIRKKSLAEVLGSEFFRSIRRRWPYSRNQLRPCLIIDHPRLLREVVEECAPHATHEGAETVLTRFSEELDKYASEYGRLADALWEEKNSSLASKKKSECFSPEASPGARIQ